jgi:hypothetical protein
MATQDDVRRIALALPGTEESDEHFAFSVRAGAKVKGFAWAWRERVAPKQPKVARPDVLAVRVAGNAEKEMLLASGDPRFFTEPHYNGFPAVLVRLPELAVGELAELLTNAWRCQAPKSLAKQLRR